MGPRNGGSHRHRCEKVDDGSLFLTGDRRRTRRSRRTGCGARGGRRLRPRPHASAKQECETASRFEGEPLAKSGRSQCLVLLGHSHLRRGFLEIGAGAGGGVFFPPSARSIVLGWTSTENFCWISLASSRARSGSPGTTWFSTKARRSPWSLWGPRGPLFFGTSPASPASSKLALA